MTARDPITNQKVIDGAAAVMIGGGGGDGATPITKLPHTLAQHSAVGDGAWHNLPSGNFTVQATAEDNGGTITSGSVVVEVSNDLVGIISLGPIGVTTDGTSDGFPVAAGYAYVRTRCAAFAGSGSTPRINTTLNI